MGWARSGLAQTRAGFKEDAMTCPCGKPIGHTGRHRIYPTDAQRAAARRSVKLAACRRWRERQRALGKCVTCGAYTDKYARCAPCRVKDSAERSIRYRRRAA
jgi:hypothetical protein